MANFLCIPIHLDALFLPTAQAVVEAHADFSRLPYVAKDKSDVNADTPFLSNEITSKPLQDEGLYLHHGVHLHWALPYALTCGLQEDKTGVLKWPTVPNRWLVTRIKNGVSQKQWVVDSDYLYSDDKEQSTPKSITYLINAEDTEDPRPFRYMGRQLLLDDWKKAQTESSEKYLKSPLTTIGYGDPNFAALYPNCYGVFGFYDDEIATKEDLQNLQYDIVGWYAHPNDDFLNPGYSFWLQHVYKATCAKYDLLVGLSNPNDKKDEGLKLAGALNQDQKRAALESEFNWVVDKFTGDFPQRSLYFANLTFTASPNVDLAADSNKIKIAVGNTGTEALSAYLAQHVPDQLKFQVEDQLEALLLQSEGKKHQLDWSFKFREARHEKGFTPYSGGTVWSIRSDVPKQKKKDPPQDSGLGLVAPALPSELADLLNQLNDHQQTLDRAHYEADDLRRLLYADWCKYQRSAYPPEDSRWAYPQPDEVRYFIEQKNIPLLKSQLAQIEIHTSARDKTQNDITTALQNLNDEIKGINQKYDANFALYNLQSAPGARYWRANDPVLLLAGDGIKPSTRHENEQTFQCKIFAADDSDDLIKTLNSLREQISHWKTELALIDANVGFFEWAKQPWHPYLLEWEVEVLPVQDGSNLDPQTYAYQSSFIDEHFELQTDQVDLNPKSGTITKAANIYTGRSLLTPHASKNLTDVIKVWLNQQEGLKTKDPAYENIAAAYKQLETKDIYFQSQSLGGFHDALRMQQPTYQMPLRDPLGFADHQAFTQQVANLIGNGNRATPAPLNDFNPIRTGALALINLRLVDTFGRTRTLVKDGQLDAIITAETLTPPKDSDVPNHWVYLPPRLAQPARLDFHWLAAESALDEMKMNSHPDTNPICGWLLPNNLDRSLQVYSAAGNILGWVTLADDVITWQSAPGVTPPINAETIPNKHLRKVVQQILATYNTATNFDLFLNTLNAALENIYPENSTQHDALALLMGRPIAVTRASLRLTLRGLPAIHHSWDRFRQDLVNVSPSIPRSTDGFTSVEFPVRLGDQRQLNDGLLGYWVEDENGALKESFYSPQLHPDETMNRLLTLETASRETYTMLLDPRGVVHAHSGILPMQMLSIPPDQYGPALKAIEPFFLTSPILTPTGHLTLPLPDEPGFKWLWQGGRQNGSEWLPATGIEKPNLQANFPVQQQIVEGWLKLHPDDSPSKNDPQ